VPKGGDESTECVRGEAMDNGGGDSTPMRGFSSAKKRHTNIQQSQSQSASSWGRNLIPLSSGNYFTTHFPFYFFFSLSHLVSPLLIITPNKTNQSVNKLFTPSLCVGNRFECK